MSGRQISKCMLIITIIIIMYHLRSLWQHKEKGTIIIAIWQTRKLRHKMVKQHERVLEASNNAAWIWIQIRLKSKSMFFPGCCTSWPVKTDKFCGAIPRHPRFLPWGPVPNHQLCPPHSTTCNCCSLTHWGERDTGLPETHSPRDIKTCHSGRGLCLSISFKFTIRRGFLPPSSFKCLQNH